MESALEELELARHHLTAVEQKACRLITAQAALFLVCPSCSQHLLLLCLGQSSLTLNLDAALPYAG
jgi:hypothetical protein